MRTALHMGMGCVLITTVIMLTIVNTATCACLECCNAVVGTARVLHQSMWAHGRPDAQGAARQRQSRRDNTCNASRRDLPLAETLGLKITLLFSH